MQNKLVESQHATSDMLIPLMQDLQKQNALLEDSRNLPYYNIDIEDVTHSTPKRGNTTYIDVDKNLDETDR